MFLIDLALVPGLSASWLGCHRSPPACRQQWPGDRKQANDLLSIPPFSICPPPIFPLFFIHSVVVTEHLANLPVSPLPTHTHHTHSMNHQQTKMPYRRWSSVMQCVSHGMVFLLCTDMFLSVKQYHAQVRDMYG